MTTAAFRTISVSLYDVTIKQSVTFSYKKRLVEYVDGSLLNYDSPIVYQGVISTVTMGLVLNDQKINAIKQLRVDNDGLGLKEAKDIAEALLAYNLPKKEENWKDAVSDKFRHTLSLGSLGISYPPDSLLAPNKKIEYIKWLRANNGIGLKEAKDIADHIWQIRDIH